MADLEKAHVPEVSSTPAVSSDAPLLVFSDEDIIPGEFPDGYEPVDVVVVKFVLDSVIDFLEELKLSGEPLRHAGQLLKDVERLRITL